MRAHIRSFQLLALLALSCLTPCRTSAQVLNDPVSVPVTYGVKHRSSISDTWCDLAFNLNTSPQHFDGVGWHELHQTEQLVPGRKYQALLRVSPQGVEEYKLDVRAPDGYRVFINGTERYRWSQELPTDEGEWFTVQIVEDTAVPTGVCTSLRPGRVIWSVGLGALTNGRAAGSIVLRQVGLTEKTFTPEALVYESTSSEVEVMGHVMVPSYALRQIRAPSILVDTVVDSSSKFRLKFYPNDSSHVSSGKTPRDDGDVLYTVSGDPLYEYIIENPDAEGLNAIRITKITRQGGAEVTMWTELRRVLPDVEPSSETWLLKDWCEKAAGATEVDSPVCKRWKYTQSMMNELVTIEDEDESVVQSTRNIYYQFPWGTELISSTIGDGLSNPLATTYAYYTDSSSGGYSRLQSVSRTGSDWAYYEYYDDFDKYGVVKKIYRPCLESSSAASADASGEVTEYTYTADWSGAVRLPEVVTVSVGGIVVKKSAWTYGTETFTDASRTYSDPAKATMPLQVQARMDYSDATHFVTTTTKVFREDGDPEHHFFPGLVHSIQRPDGTMTVAAYFRGTYDVSTRNFIASQSGPGFLAMMMEGTTVAMDGSVPSPTCVVGTQSSNTEANFRLIPGSSTAAIIVRGAQGLPILEEKLIYAGSTWNIAERNASPYLDGVFRWYTSRDSGNASVFWDVTRNAWTRGRLDSTTDESGVVTNYTYDAAGRVSTMTRSAASSGSATIKALTVTYGYDAAGHVTSETVSGEGTETLVTSRQYDLAGRLTSETSPGVSATTYSYEPTSNRTTVTLPTGSTQITEYYPEGRIKQVTGTGVVAEYYTYEPATGHTTVRLGTNTNSRLRETWQDWLGRTTSTSRPGFTGQPAFVESATYDFVTGQLAKVAKTGSAATLYQYNGMGEMYRSGLDINADDQLTLASSDRIVDSSKGFEELGGAYWATVEQLTYPVLNSLTPQRVGLQRTRLTGRTASLRGEVRTVDINNNERVTTTSVDSANRLVTVSTTEPGFNSPETAVILNGVTISTTRHDGLTYGQTYDGLSRPSGAVDPRVGTSVTTYWPGTTLVKTVSDATATTVQSTWYDTAGRPTVVSDALGKSTRYAYTERGEVKQSWGSGAYPVSFNYNAFGERTGMSTYQDRDGGTNWDAATWPGSSATANTTVWNYDDPSGLLERKTDAAGHAVVYTYTATGQTHERVSARNIKTTYAYDDNTAELAGITYTDGTPSVSYEYNRMGHSTTVTDATGSRILARCTCGRVENESLPEFYGNRILTYQYATEGRLGRYKGYKLGSASDDNADMEQAFSYTPSGRFDTTTAFRTGDSGQVFQYGYLANSDLVSSVAAGSFSRTTGYELKRNLVSSISGKWNTAVKTQFDYQYTSVYQRSTVVSSGEAYTNEYGDSLHQIFNYDDRGEVTFAGTFLGAAPTDQTTMLSARRFEYGYDAAGNRKWSNTSGKEGLKEEYTANALNQYSSRENLALPVGGTAATNANVVVGGGTARAGRAGRYWGDNVAVSNASAPFYGNLSIYAAIVGGGSGGADLLATQSRAALLAAFGQSFQYDADGNLTNDGIYAYAWDAENRLLSVQPTEAALIAHVPKQRLIFKYDYADRRVEKTVLAWSTAENNWVATKQRRYLYDDSNLIAEFSVNSTTEALTLNRTYAWGLDMSGSLSATGGVGALLQIADPSGAKYYPTYDGNGNVASLVNASTGALAAVYEYGPYGEIQRAEAIDPAVADQPFRFSTKFYDTETRLVYYGRRYYDPANGRFINRDPIEEQGGLNLYGFVGNDPVNRVDYLGMLPPHYPKDGETWPEIGKDGETIWYTSYCDRFGSNCNWGLAFGGMGLAFGGMPGDSGNMMPAYVVTYNQRSGITTGSVNGEIVAYGDDSGFGRVMDEISGAWLSFGPDPGQDLTSAPDSGGAAKIPGLTNPYAVGHRLDETAGPSSYTLGIKAIPPGLSMRFGNVKAGVESENSNLRQTMVRIENFGGVSRYANGTMYDNKLSFYVASGPVRLDVASRSQAVFTGRYRDDGSEAGTTYSSSWSFGQKVNLSGSFERGGIEIGAGATLENRQVELSLFSVQLPLIGGFELVAKPVK